jgi:hypothetical protein
MLDFKIITHAHTKNLQKTYLLAAVVKPQKIVKTVRFQTLRSSLLAQKINPLLLPAFLNAEAKFIVPDSGDIVNSGIGLSYRLSSLCSRAGIYDNRTPELTLSPPPPVRDYEFGY